MTTKTPMKKVLSGTVVKKSGDKTVAVEVLLRRQHLMYGKTQESAKRYLVHDPRNTVQVGQTVQIRETRPLSARKRWIVVYDS